MGEGLDQGGSEDRGSKYLWEGIVSGFIRISAGLRNR